MLIRLYVTGCGNPVRAGGIAAAVSSPLDQRLADIRSQRAIESWNRHATPMGYIYPRSPYTHHAVPVVSRSGLPLASIQAVTRSVRINVTSLAQERSTP